MIDLARILAVVLYHAGGVLPRGYAGVDTFFVLSGFVITRMVWQRRELTGRVSASWFFARRIRRLLPAATVALLVTAADLPLLNAEAAANVISQQRSGS